MALKNTCDMVKQAIQDVIAPQLQELRGEMAGLRGEIRQLEKRFEDGLDHVNRRLDEGLGAVNQCIDDLNRRIDEGFTQVGRRIDETNKRVDETINIRERLAALEAAVRLAPQ